MECNQNLGYLLNKAGRMAKCVLNNKLSAFDITAAQWLVLKDIAFQEEQCQDEEERLHKLTPAAIADRLQADRPTVSGMIERLVKQQLVNRVSNPRDRRSQIILLTDKAKELLPQLNIMSVETMDLAVKDFTAAEVEKLKDYLIRIIKNLD